MTELLQDELKFLEFIDEQIETHPELVLPADEGQLNRISKLLLPDNQYSEYF